MENISIANKYRPQRFDDVRGQRSSVESIKGKLRDGKVPRTALFCGKHGTGKTTIARILAKAVNCEHPDADGNPCCKCQSCISIDAGVNGDVIELDAASHNKVEDAENIVKQASYLPNGNKKVIILDEAHMFSKAAQNKLLKVFEEPPAHVIFIFCTTEEDGLLDTILSRCNKFTFNSISDSDILDNLKMVCEKEGIEYEEDALKLITKKADGHVRDSLSLLEQLSYDKLTSDRIREELGIPTDDQIFDLLQLVLLKDMQSVMSKVDAVIKQGNISEFLKMLVETLCYICTFDENIEDTQTSSYRGYCSMIKENTSTNTLLGFVNIITKCLRDNRGLGLDLAVRLCFLTMINEAEKEDKINFLEEKVMALTKEMAQLKTAGVPMTVPPVAQPVSPSDNVVSGISPVDSPVSQLPDDSGWQPIDENTFGVTDMPTEVTEEELETVPFEMPPTPAVSSTPVLPAAAPIPDATETGTQPPADIPFEIPGGTIVSSTPATSASNTESEVHSDESSIPTSAVPTSFNDIGSFGGMFGSTDARLW